MSAQTVQRLISKAIIPTNDSSLIQHQMASKPWNKDSRSLLLASAAATNNADQAAVLRLLLNNGANIHDWDANGNTCLHLILSNARPERPWTIQSLIELVHAGADPSQANHAGLTAFDVACQTGTEFGSFRRDILLQALIEGGSDILDERLLMPTEMTPTYTPLHHALVCGDAFAGATLHLRQTLLNRLARTTHRPSIGATSLLYYTAVDRVLPSNGSQNPADPEATFGEAQGYLQRILRIRQQVKCMIQQRIPYESWAQLGRVVNVRQAETTALLEFDWFRPVDPEDVFISQIDHLIQQLEDLSLDAFSHERFNSLIAVLEDSIPKSQQRTSQQLQPVPAKAVERPKITITLNEEQMNRSTPEGSDSFSPRKESMVKTPIQFYLCQLQNDDALPLSQSQRL